MAAETSVSRKSDAAAIIPWRGLMAAAAVPVAVLEARQAAGFHLLLVDLVVAGTGLLAGGLHLSGSSGHLGNDALHAHPPPEDVSDRRGAA